MTVVEIDGVDPQSLKTSSTCSLDILGIGPESMPSIRLSLEPELGGQEDVIALAGSFDPFLTTSSLSP
jgi:hypothetical protein